MELSVVNCADSWSDHPLITYVVWLAELDRGRLGEALPGPVDAHPGHVSPVGVREMAGNAVVSFALAHGGPGALGGAIGAGGGWMIGAAIAKSRAAGKVAAGDDGVTVIPLDSIASLQAVKATGIGGLLGGQSLLVTTADRAEYRFGVKLGKWSAGLASALTARGREVRTTPQGMAITPAHNPR